MSNQQLPIHKKVDFCLQYQECRFFDSDPLLDFEISMGKKQLSKIVKKYSINTASSNMEEEEEEGQRPCRYTQEQLQMTNIELLESISQSKISQQPNIYPSSFTLIKIPPKLQHVTLKQLSSFSFSVLSYSINDLIKFSTQIIYSNQYAQKIFTRQKMEELVFMIATNYNKVAYHNFSHAFSLMQLNFQCLEIMPDFKRYFSSQELFYTFIAGLSHDLNHNGTNNMFEVKRKTDLALMYNNEAVLQNMHVSTLWKILRQKPELNFLQKAQQPYKTKEMITKLILSTDMSSHFKKLEILQKRRTQNNVNLQKIQDKMFMMEQIFHSCDLGNPTLEYDSYMSWAALLSHQFNEQAKMQRLYEIEVTKSFQYHDFSTLYNDQVWFVGKIVYPLWKQISLHFTQLSILRKKIEQNSEKLNGRLTQQELKVRI